MFLAISLLCVFPIYNLAVPLQPLSITDIFKEVAKKSFNKSESDAFFPTVEEWKSSHQNLMKLAQSNSTLENNLFNWGKLTDGLREEMLVMVDGSHLKFPLSEKRRIELQHKTISIAVSRLLMNLKTMQQTDNLIRNITLKLFMNNFEQFVHTDFGRSVTGRELSETILRSLMRDFFRILNYQMETDVVLRDEYKWRMNEARRTLKKDPKMSAPLMEIKAWDEYTDTEELKNLFEDKKTFRRSYLNDLFLQFSNEHIEENLSSSDPKLFGRYILAKALTLKAVVSSNSESEVNDIYQGAIMMGEEALWNKGIWTFSDRKDPVEIATTLFDLLELNMLSRPILSEEINFLKEDIKLSVYNNARQRYRDAVSSTQEVTPEYPAD